MKNVRKLNMPMCKKGEINFAKVPYVSPKELGVWRKGSHLVYDEEQNEIFVINDCFDSDNVYTLDYYVTSVMDRLEEKIRREYEGKSI